MKLKKDLKANAKNPGDKGCENRIRRGTLAKLWCKKVEKLRGQDSNLHLFLIREMM